MAEEKKKINYVVYDLETGGFNSEEEAITEIAMIAIDGETLEEIERYTTFIKPYGNLNYTDQALKSTGITMEMINSGKDPKIVVKEVSEFLQRQGTAMNKKPILCGHNIIKFDNSFLVKLFSLHRRDLYSLINKDMFFDTMWISRMRSPFDEDEFGKHSLSNACSREGIEVIDAHRAMNDTAANASLVVSYLRYLRGVGSSVEREKKHNYRDTFKF